MPDPKRYHLRVVLPVANILIIIELHKTFDDFSVVCGDSVRLFVALLFGRLEKIHSAVWSTGSTSPHDFIPKLFVVFLLIPRPFILGPMLLDEVSLRIICGLPL